MMKAFQKIDKVFQWIITALCLGCAIMLFLILVANVFFRMVPLLSAVPSFSMGWFDEIVQLLTAWMIMLAATLLTRRKDHFMVTLLPDKLKGKRVGCWYDAFINLMTGIFYACLCYYGFQLVIGAAQHTPVLKISMRVLYLSIPVNMLFMTVFEIVFFVQNIHKGIRFLPRLADEAK